MAAYDPLKAKSPGTGLEHVPSYWTATAGAAPNDDGALGDRTEIDVAIIGAGYTGLSCAYHLARAGVTVVVLEANRVGWGCSGRNGGFARAAIGRHSYGRTIELWGIETARAVFRQALDALEHVRTLVREGGIECDALETGHLKVAHRPNRAAALAREAALLEREFHYPAEFLDAQRVRAEHIGGDEAHGALRIPDAIALHPLKLAFGVLRLARAAGARVHSASPVLEWRKEGTTHLLVTPAATLHARRVVLATNGYTPEHLHDCLRATTLPALSHIIVTRPMTREEKSAAGFRTDHVLTDTRNLLYYWRRLRDDRILFGGRGRIVETSGGQHAQRDFLLSELRRKLPALDSIEVGYDWAGWVCLTADFLPHIHHALDDPSVHYAIGYQGSGVSYALYAGKLLASRLAGDSIAEAIPPTTTPLPRFPLAAFRRAGQRALYRWYRYLDARG